MVVSATEVADDVNDEVDQHEDDEDVDQPDVDEQPVTFPNKQAYIDAVNKVVKRRLKRNDEKYAPVVAERDTLKTRVDELTAASGGKSDTPDQSQTLANQQLQQQVAELLNYKQSTEREKLVRGIAKEKGLPEEFLPRVQGDNPDDIESDIDELVETLTSLGSISGDGQPRPVKGTKPKSKDEGKGSKGSSGAGEKDDEEKIDPQKLAAEIPRYGMPYVVK